MQAIVLHPSLPIFPPTPAVPRLSAKVPMPTPQTQSYQRAVNIYPQQPFPPSATLTAGLFTRAETNPNAPMNFIRKVPSTQGSPAPIISPISSLSQPLFTHVSSAPSTLAAQGGEDSRESTPASPPYPKPGSGLMAKLGPDEEDLEWLVDGTDFDAFSHTVYDDHGEKAEENGVAVNGNVLA
jgi:hypothetical protein